MGVIGALCFSFHTASSQEVRPDAPVVSDTVQTVTPVKRDVLKFYNVHTKENLTVTRCRGDSIQNDANYFLRDHRRNINADMKPELFDLLGEIKDEIHRRYPNLPVEFHVISGFRSAETNTALINAKKRPDGPAQKSQHIENNAIDIRVPGLSSRVLRDIATCIGKGGVGYYAADNFVHVDLARVRYWPSHDYLKNLKCP